MVTIETVDLTAFSKLSLDARDEKVKAGRALVDALHNLGFVKIKGHGVSREELDEAFAWAKKLFHLPTSQKMKAPHPAGNMPHRGYSGLGQEKVYNKDDVGGDKSPEELRKISDYKESYEIGSEHDDQQQNIWLPYDVLPGFRAYMTSLYQRLAGVGSVILQAIAVGLGLDLDDEAYDSIRRLQSPSHCQLRLLHYPPITKQKLQTNTFTRLPAHTDWGTFTILFQDTHGGLELRDPKSGEFVHAEPEEGTLVLNVGDMLQRFTNDYFTSALHRVTVPSPEDLPQEDSSVPARYSIPFFVAPAPSHTVATLGRFITPETPAKYEPVKFEEYGALVSKYQYQDSES
ncbi:Clavaminate synthase-like protein [Cladorrhinum sp. PSN259]|nr:Clavaminate synthase-like protein [Cladorrhinum sp. PSN259]